jgi:hypothetical protein
VEASRKQGLWQLMDSGLEAAGALATAAAAANAIDPDEPHGRGHGTACLNCGVSLQGDYCSNCGQKAHVHRSVFHAVEEFLHGITHFDSKLWNTLPLLLFRPGKLTREYVQGKRARYVAPVALFLLTIFSMFLLFGFLPAPTLEPGVVQMDEADLQKSLAELTAKIADMDSRIAAAEAELAAAPDKDGPQQEVAALKVSRALAESARVRLETGKGSSPPGDVFGTIRDVASSGQMNVSVGNSKLEEKIRASLSDPEFVFYKMKQKGYKLSFLLVPLSLPWMILLFLGKRDVHVYDHVVFLLYSISFMSMLAMFGAIFATYTDLPPGFYVLLFGLVPIAHMYAQLKGGYMLGRASAAWRTALLGVFAILTLAAYFVGILLLGLLD